MRTPCRSALRSPTLERGITMQGSSCAQYPEYAPQYYDEHSLPSIPIKTVRIMFHVFQKDDGSGNWQMPAQDGGADEALLRGLVTGLTQYPAGSGNYTRDIRGLNNIFAQLDQRSTVASPGPNAHGTPDAGAGADTRIRFQLEGIRYYRNSYFWNMTANSPGGCGDGLDCQGTYYTTLITNSTASQDMSGTALTAGQKESVIHIFFGENPGLPSTLVDQFGNPTSRYGTGGAAAGVPEKYLYCRGFYWTIKQHPYWAAGGVRNADPHQAFKYSTFVLAHELGHCLGLWHTYDGTEECSTSYQDPATSYLGENNNIMGSPSLPGFSLSTCQIGKMHYYLGHAGEILSRPNTSLGTTLVPDFCQHDPSQDVYIKAGTTEEWHSAHNLQGNLYIEPGATLVVYCRVGFVGPEAKVVVRGGGTLVLDNGTLGNYALNTLQECDQDLVLWLGGDGSDGDNSGLITIRNGGGFTSQRLKAVLTEGATLHTEAVPVLLEGSQLTTLGGSFLCMERGVTLQYVSPANFTISPGTILGLNPAITLQADCQQDLCDLMPQLATFTASTVSVRQGGTIVNTLCPGSPVTMTAAAPQPSTVTWYKDGLQVASTAQYTDSPTGTTSVTYSVEVTFDNGCPPATWSFTQPIAPNPTIQLIQNSVSICPQGAAPDYTADGYFKVNALFNSAYNLYNASAAPNAGKSYYILDGANPGGTLLSMDQSSGALQLNVGRMRALGLNTYQLQICNRSQPNAGRCQACAALTLTLQSGAGVAVPTPAPVCLGQSVVLQANGPANGSYQWQPGGMSGATITVAPTATTTYTVTYTLGNSCPVTKDVTVTVRRPTCIDCLANNYIDVNSAGTSFAGYTFAPGKTYVFNQNTWLTSSTYVVPEGARLLFGPGVTLTLSSGGQLDLRGGQLTAICDEMWEGIVADATSGGVVSQKPVGVTYSEISHSRNGLVLTNTASSSGGQPALQLIYVAFRHNGQGVQVRNQAFSNYAFTGVITNCLFDSDPHQMLAPWQYVSAQDLHVSQRHLAFSGRCTNLTVQDCTLDHALFGVWVPSTAPFTATRNIFRNLYVAGVYASDALTPDTHLTKNQFFFPAPGGSDGIIGSHSPQLQSTFNLDLGSEGPTSLLHEGVCVGIYGPTTGTSTLPFVLTDNEFVQNAFLPSYGVIYPQYGVSLRGGAVSLQRSTFRNLSIGYESSASQSGGQVRDNLFSNCRYGVRFVSTQNHTTSLPGSALVSCNTFERPNNVSGTSFNIIREFCQAQAITDPCDQINISTVNTPLGSSAILQKNRFVHPSAALSGNDVAFDVYNADSNGAMTYATFDSIVPTVIVNGTQVAVQPTNQVLTSPANGTVSNPANDCASEGIFSNGLQARTSAPSTPGGQAVDGKPEAFLAQNVPNPCSGSTSISYRTASGSGEAELVIRDYFSGAVVQRQVVPMGTHTVEVNVSKLRPGSYHYALEVGGRPVAHHNLLVQ